MRYATDPKEIEMIEHYMELAALEAQKSTCNKSKRGAVLVRDGEVIGRGYNMPTIGELCDPCIRESIHDNSRVELCSAIHAEQMAIIDAIKKGGTLEGSRMYHIKVKDGEKKPSGRPSCTVCSRMLYVAGIELVLLHKDGYAIYTPGELNQKSFETMLEGFRH